MVEEPIKKSTSIEFVLGLITTVHHQTTVFHVRRVRQYVILSGA